MRRYLTFGSVALALFVGSINATAVSVAFPVLVRELDTSLVVAGWMFTVYQLTNITVMPLAGKITSIIGRGRAFLLFLLTFVVGSLLCSFAPNTISLILFRVVQAAGNAGFIPCASEIVSSQFPNSRQRAIGFFSSILPIGEIIGPNIGAWLVPSFGWRSTFIFSASLGTLVLLVAWVLLRSHKAPAQRRSVAFDLPGAALLTLTLVPLMLGLTQMGQAKTTGTWLTAGLLFSVALAGLFMFVRRERTAREPVVDLNLLRQRPFLASNVYHLLYGLSAFGIFNLIPLYAISVYNAPVSETGIIMTPRYVGMLIFSTVSTLLLARVGYRRPILVGTSLMLVGLVLLAMETRGFTVLGVGIGPTTMLMLVMFVCGSGTGLVAPASNNASIDLMPDKIATIVAVRGMFRTIGSTIGIAVSTLVLQEVGDMPTAFTYAFALWAVVFLLAFPAIIGMPARPSARR